MAQATTAMPTIDYETTIFTLKADNLGPNKATLIHGRTTKNNSQFYKAILYIHGYSDYFFQDHLCEQFLEHGYDFFALDLRKCGRSIISPAQDRHRHYCTDLREYDEEITLSIEHITKQTNNKIKKLILYGHSTGGIIISTYASSNSRYQDIAAIIFNSPFLAPFDKSATETVLEKVATRLNLSVDIDDHWYGRSIHTSDRGEWDFDIKIKPLDKIRVHGASFAAIRAAQNELVKKGSCIKCPILLMCSNRSIKPDKTWRDEYGEVDLLLNVTTMRRVASTMGPEVTLYEVENAKHDVFLSKASVREKAFHLMFRWLKHLEEDWTIST